MAGEGVARLLPKAYNGTKHYCTLGVGTKLVKKTKVEAMVCLHGTTQSQEHSRKMSETHAFRVLCSKWKTPALCNIPLKSNLRSTGQVHQGPGLES